MVPLLWATVSESEQGDELVFPRGRKQELLLGALPSTRHIPTLLLSPTHLGPLVPGSRQVRLAVPGAYEKPQLLPLQPPMEASPPATFTFHVNPVLRSRLDVELAEKLTILQVSEPRAWRRWMTGIGPA